MTRLASYADPFGACIELHRDRNRFWTERPDAEGTSVVEVDTLGAAEWYELALTEGHVEKPFPFGLPVTR